MAIFRLATVCDRRRNLPIDGYLLMRVPTSISLLPAALTRKRVYAACPAMVSCAAGPLGMKPCHQRADGTEVLVLCPGLLLGRWPGHAHPVIDRAGDAGVALLVVHPCDRAAARQLASRHGQ